MKKEKRKKKKEKITSISKKINGCPPQIPPK